MHGLELTIERRYGLEANHIKIHMKLTRQVSQWGIQIQFRMYTPCMHPVILCL